MEIFGITANLMSFGGLAIAIGMMVDGPIVIVENICRIFSENYDKKEKQTLIEEACAELMKSIIFSILIIIIVFLPIFTLTGVEGKMFKPLAYTVALAMLGSLIYSVFVTPILANLFINKANIVEPQFQSVKTFKEKYTNLLKKFSVNKNLNILVISILLVLGIISFSLLGSEFSPEMQEGDLVVKMTAPASTSLNETKRLMMLVEKRIMQIPEVKEVLSRVGRGEVGAHADPVNNAEMYVILKPKSEWQGISNQKDLEKEVRDKIHDFPGVLFNITQPIAMTVDELLEGVQADLAIKIFGDDLDLLNKHAKEVSEKVSQVSGARDVQVSQITGSPQILIEPNRKLIARYGINLSEIQNLIETAIGGSSVSQVFDGIKRFDVFVRFTEDARNDVEAIKKLLVSTPSNVKVPLGQLAEVKIITGPKQITREENQRFITVQANVSNRDIGSFVKEASNLIEKTVSFPSGYFITWGGQYTLQQEANKRFTVVIPLALALIFLLLYINFNSLKNSLLILVNIPLALVGGLLALLISGQSLSVPASIGFIALFGIALENGLVLIGYLEELIQKNVSIDTAILQASLQRTRPVLMTALTTGLGLIPLLLANGIGSEVQKPLATVVIGGLISSTLLTLLILPSLYKWFHQKQGGISK